KQRQLRKSYQRKIFVARVETQPQQCTVQNRNCENGDSPWAQGQLSCSDEFFRQGTNSFLST
ncbi:MAG: hypothetical protein NZ937_07780, partial [Armatimonadetes bacterium]|nr:hypothetical protein [Armatimonadota bacterium]